MSTSRVIEPASVASSPAAMRISVVLPAPFSPTIARISPPRSSRETSFTATFSPKRLVMLRSVSNSESARHFHRAVADALLDLRDFAHRVGLERRFERVVPHQRDDSFVHAEVLNLRFELMIANFFRDCDKRARHVEHGRGDDHIRREIVLIFVRAETADLLFLTRLEHAAACFIRLMEDEVAAGVDERKRGELRRSGVVEVAGVDLLHIELRIHRLRAGFERSERRGDRGEVDAADESGFARFRFACGDDAEEVGRLLELEDHRGDVRRDGVARGRDEDRVRIFRAGLLRGVLKLETVTEGEIVVFRAVRLESLDDLSRRLRLLMRDLCAELGVNSLHAFPRQRVPAVVVDRAGGKKADFHRLLFRRGARGRGRRLGLLRTGEEQGGKENQDRSLHGARLWYIVAPGGKRWTTSKRMMTAPMKSTTSRSSR